ncbi:hypothetical protein AWB71_05994 [Caballeronia peredens]|nr:hypothetical protein AWB71_05994 [Caballeronia peredens]
MSSIKTEINTIELKLRSAFFKFNNEPEVKIKVFSIIICAATIIALMIGAAHTEKDAENFMSQHQTKLAK